MAMTVGGNSSSTTYSGVLSGGGSLTKNGAGMLTLSGANTFAGLTQITAGTLQWPTENALQNSTLDYNSYGGSLSFGSLANATFGGLQGNQALALTRTGGNVALTVGGNNSSTAYSGVLSGGGTLTKTGTGTLVLSGANTYSGGTTISQGTLQLGNGGTQGTIASTTVTDNGTLAVNRFDTYTLGSNNSGSGSLIQQGSGTLILSGANSYNGGTTISAGTSRSATAAPPAA